jgi:hypothetical protein
MSRARRPGANVEELVRKEEQLQIANAYINEYVGRSADITRFFFLD